MDEKITLAKRVGGFVSTILLGETKELIIRIDERVKNLTGDVSELKSNVQDIQKTLTQHESDISALKAHAQYGVAHSPTIPNERGEKLLKDSGFYLIYPVLKPKIFRWMEAWHLPTLYNYEKNAIAALFALRDDPLVDCLKEYAVNHPDESLDLIFHVASWVIRDDFLHDHPVRKVALAAAA
jgi:hypothetical protein